MKRNLALALASLAIAGCRTVKPPSGPAPYFGPTEPIAAVVAAINANSRKLPTLVAGGTFEATLYDENKHRDWVNGSVRLALEKPRGLRIAGTKAGVDVFEVGSNAERFWLIVQPQDLMWAGSWDKADSGAMTAMPIQPQLLQEVLGISDIEEDFRHGEMPVMRFNPDADAYMFVWVLPRPDRLVATKEVWFDRVTKRPKIVVLFDDNGRVVLRAFLSRYMKAEIDGEPESAWPTIAGRYDLFFPDSGSKLQIDLEEARRDEDGVPNDATFAFPSQRRAKVSRVINLDESR